MVSRLNIGSGEKRRRDGDEFELDAGPISDSFLRNNPNEMFLLFVVKAH